MSSSKSATNSKILVVDDERDVLDFLKIYLESLSWQVLTADTTQEAFEILQHETCFCVLTDIAMPDMDGYEFVSAVKKRGSECETILMTGFGYNPNHTLVKLNRLDRYPCLFKPFNRAKLAEAVQSAHETYHKNRDARP
jgi:DNA-binding NtrC family response regulator